MAFKTREGAPIEGWAALGAGTVIEGKFLKVREHESPDYGIQQLVDIEVHGLRRTFGCPAILRDRLTGLAEGTVVRIEYGGLKDQKKPAGRGNPHMFIVQEWEEDGTDEEGNKLPF